MLHRVHKTAFTIRQIYINLLTKNVFNTAFAQKKPKKRQEMKPYQVLLTSPPVSQININVIKSSAQLTFGFGNNLLHKSSKKHKEIKNSVEVSIEVLETLKHTKFFQRGFVLLVQNLINVTKDQQLINNSGIFKINVAQKLIQIINQLDSLYSEICIQALVIFLIKTIQISNANRKQFFSQKQEVDLRIKDLIPLLSDENLSEDQKKQVLTQYQKEKQILVLMEWKFPFFSEEDLLSAINFIIQKGYYTQKIIQQVKEIIKTDYNLQFAKKTVQNRQKKSKSSYISCLFKLVTFKLKLLNSFKSFQIQNKKADMKQKVKTTQNTKSIKVNQASNQKVHINNKEELEIQKQIIKQEQYKKLVKLYVQILENSQYLCCLFDDRTVKLTENLQTVFYTSIFNKQQKKTGKINVSMADVKDSYVKLVKKIFDIRANGVIYAQRQNIVEIFEIVLKLFDYEDRQDVVSLLQCFEHFCLRNNEYEFQNHSVFYVCQKYKYRSNFLAHKFFKYILKSYNAQKKQMSLKQEMIFRGVQMCKSLSLYFKLLQQHQQQTLSSPISKYNKQINQAIELFLGNYNKLISVLYFSDQKLGFIDNCVQMKYQILKKKKIYKTESETNTKQDIRQILSENRLLLKNFARNLCLKNCYFNIKKINQKATQKQQNKDGNNIQEKQKKQKQKQKYFLDKKGVQKKQQGVLTQEQPDYTFQPYFVKHQTNIQILAQVSTILDILLRALKLQAHKNLVSAEDITVVMKRIFMSQKNKKLIQKNIAYPNLFKKLIEISNSFKNQKNQNQIFKQIYKETKFDINQLILDQRINFSKQGKSLFFLEEEIQLKTQFQENLNALSVSPLTLKNAKVQNLQDYEQNPLNIMTNLRSDVIYSANKIYGPLKKAAKQQLTEVIRKLSNLNSKAIKFQMSYLQYPYLADMAISKNNVVTIILIRSEEPYNKLIQRRSDKAVQQYLEECERYFKSGKMNSQRILSKILLTEQNQLTTQESKPKFPFPLSYCN